VKSIAFRKETSNTDARVATINKAELANHAKARPEIVLRNFRFSSLMIPCALGMKKTIFNK
jgi:hypothetical protein